MRATDNNSVMSTQNASVGDARQIGATIAHYSANPTTASSYSNSSSINNNQNQSNSTNSSITSAIMGNGGGDSGSTGTGSVGGSGGVSHHQNLLHDTGNKRLHVSNIPFRYRDPDLRVMFEVSSLSSFLKLEFLCTSMIRWYVEVRRVPKDHFRFTFLLIWEETQLS